MMFAPVASASCVTSSPPTTSDSLLASARSIPSPSVATVGTNPAEPTIAFRTRSHRASVTNLTSPSGPESGSPAQPPPAGGGPWGSPSAPRPTPSSPACSSSVCHSLPALSPTTSSSPPLRETTSSACRPIEPVEPRITSRRATSTIVGARLLLRDGRLADDCLGAHPHDAAVCVPQGRDRNADQHLI